MYKNFENCLVTSYTNTFLGERRKQSELRIQDASNEYCCSHYLPSFKLAIISSSNNNYFCRTEVAIVLMNDSSFLMTKVAVIHDVYHRSHWV